MNKSLKIMALGLASGLLIGAVLIVFYQKKAAAEKKKKREFINEIPSLDKKAEI